MSLLISVKIYITQYIVISQSIYLKKKIDNRFWFESFYFALQK